MYNLLEQLNIEFESEYKPKWISPRKYDFYTPTYNTIIEMDGGLGHGYKTHSKDNKTVLETKQIDIYKDKLALEHKIEVIRINCLISNISYIKNNIINSSLMKIFDLAQIDWNRCEEFALSNRVKEVCEFKRDNYDMSTTKIGIIMNLDRLTVRNYLKKGTQIWDWCKYNAKEETEKSYKRKKLEVFKNGISLGIFESASELSRQSVNILGVNLFSTGISSVALHKASMYKGFTFKFLDDVAIRVPTISEQILS